MQISFFEALADPSRRAIIETLRHGEMPVNDIVTAVVIHQSGVSRHLRILHRAGFVHMRAVGQQRFYSLSAQPFVELDDWLNGYRGLWEARLARLDDALKRKPKAEKKR